MTDQVEKARRFLALHHGERPLLMPNPWDRGSARLLASLGFQALATTSSGFAATLGRLDGRVTRDEALAHAAAIVARRPTCRCRPTSRTASPTTRPAWPRPCGWPSAPGWPGARSRTSPAPPTTPIYDAGPGRRAGGGRGRGRPRGPGAASCSPPGPRTTCTAGPTWPTPSPASRPTRRPAPTCSTPPGSPSLDDIRQVVSAVDRPVNVLALPGRPAGGRAGRGRGRRGSRSAARSPSPPWAPSSRRPRELRDAGHLRLLGPCRHRGQGRCLGLHLRVGCARGPRGPAWRGRRWGPGRAGSRRR